MSVSVDQERLLRRAYESFNARDIEAAIALMHPDDVGSAMAAFGQLVATPGVP